MAVIFLMGPAGAGKRTIETQLHAESYDVRVLSKASLYNGDVPGEDCISFFIDADDSELNERLWIDKTSEDYKKEIRLRSDERKYSDSADYIIANHGEETICVNYAVELIKRLLELRGKSSFLSEYDIRLMTKCGMLVENYNENNIKGASYDLSLGDDYYYAGDIISLDNKNPILTIEPYDYAIVSCREVINLPKDVVAHFGLTVGLFCQGLILSNGQQVDPGFRGTLFCLLFNTSNKTVTIKKGEKYSTIDFFKMDRLVDKYKGKYQEKRKIADIIPDNSLKGAINELKQEVEELKSESRNLQNLYISVIAIIVAAISVLLIFNGV